MPNSVESLGYIKCYSSSSSRSAKSPSNSIRHNCQKICCCSRKAIRKKATFFQVINKPIIYKFFKDFTSNRTKTKRAVDLSPKFLNTGTTYETFKQFGKQDSFRHILKCSACMYESLGSQFFRSTTGIQSGLDAFDESRFAMTFLINHSTSMIRRNMYIKILQFIGLTFELRIGLVFQYTQLPLKSKNTKYICILKTIFTIHIQKKFTNLWPLFDFCQKVWFFQLS